MGHLEELPVYPGDDVSAACAAPQVDLERGLSLVRVGPLRRPSAAYRGIVDGKT